VILEADVLWEVGAHRVIGEASRPSCRIGLLFCVVFAIKPHEPHATSDGGYLRGGSMNVTIYSWSTNGGSQLCA
jgi:hypothetical protein